MRGWITLLMLLHVKFFHTRSLANKGFFKIYLEQKDADEEKKLTQIRFAFHSKIYFT